MAKSFPLNTPKLRDYLKNPSQNEAATIVTKRHALSPNAKKLFLVIICTIFEVIEMSWQNNAPPPPDIVYLNNVILPSLLKKHTVNGNFTVTKTQGSNFEESIYNSPNGIQIVYRITDDDNVAGLSHLDSIEITLKDLKKSEKDQFLEYYSTGEQAGDCFIQKRIWNDPVNEGFVEEDICNG